MFFREGEAPAELKHPSTMNRLPRAAIYDFVHFSVVKSFGPAGSAGASPSQKVGIQKDGFQKGWHSKRFQSSAGNRYAARRFDCEAATKWPTVRTGWWRAYQRSENSIAVLL